MKKIETSLPGVFILEPQIFGDERGFLFESFNRNRFAEIGLNNDWVQDNQSHSQRGVLRGLHYQWPRAQAKLCRVAAGEALDVAVDVRCGSPTFGKWTSVLLSSSNRRQIYIPRGFAHGFVALSETVDFLYKCDEYYHPEEAFGVAWDDPQIDIDWQLPAGLELLIADRDRAYKNLREVAVENLPTLNL